ncbi:MAG: acyl-CoA carboxylase subunit beta [Pseudomonadota bacterium]
MRDEKLQEFIELEKQVKRGGSEKAIERQHSQGKLTAGERIAFLFDKDTFVELDMFAQHQCTDLGMDKKRPFRDAVITGFGKINGRKVFAYSQDATIMGGSVGFTHAQKVAQIKKMAVATKAPIIALLDSGGGRIQEGSGAYSLIFYEDILTSGVVPQISAVMGNCAGGGVYSPALTDFIFMVEGTSQMFIAGPRVIKEATGEEIGMQELGGAKPHSEISGLCDCVSKNDQECLESVRKLLSYFPSSYLEKPERVDTGDAPDRCDEGLMDIIPDNPRMPFDMAKIITKITDDGEFFEVKKNFAKNMITGFARIGGYSVGIVANQPMVYAGCLDCDASDKAARFYRTCDCFNIPIITLADVPGYLPGVKEEYKGIIRHGAKMLYGYAEATVPKISVVIRKAYGGAFAAMGSKGMGADVVLAWPTTEMAIMGPEAAVSVLFQSEIQKAEDKEAFTKQKIQEYRETFSTPYYYASRRQIDLIIRPRETRPYLVRMLEMLREKVEIREGRKHGNTPY